MEVGGCNLYPGLKKQEPLKKMHAHGSGCLVQSLLALFIELPGHMLKGKYGQDCNGEKGTGDKQEKDSSGHLAAEKCTVNFHGLKSG